MRVCVCVLYSSHEYTKLYMPKHTHFIVYDVCARAVYGVLRIILGLRIYAIIALVSYSYYQVSKPPEFFLRDSIHTFAEHILLHRMPISVILQACRICLRLC
uniref:Uncharacterized protein n=1 Tax=Oryctes rhinoceros nudivirus TaxID=92521 RepID=A0A6B9QV75_9VIRU|nr:hypothetical protein SI_OrNV_gp067 [Oryctes rhinoceros nudivirus]QKE59537.1 hypothetical protein SI_OrNV_gp067 [Oryctes rhinoceros nudivirus]UBO76484.1 hypothetical protein SI_OrNV_gp067 [Oryctes rhinoceros nudivirus]